MNLLLFRPVAVAALLALSLLTHAEPAGTRLVPEKSRIVFVSKQMGVPVEGTFGKFAAQVAFDPRKPEGGAIALSIDVGSATLGVPQSDAEMPKPEWFHAAKFPQAQFKSSAIKSLGGGQFEVVGKLTLKGQAQDVVVPVTIAQDAGLSIATGSLTIQRLAFRVGDGDWTDTSMVANDVQVRFKFTLTGLGPL
jgi:polyisoprenoid-binding protein YceI